MKHLTIDEQIRAAEVDLTTLSDERNRRQADQRAVLADADEADAEAARLDERRRALLRVAFGETKDAEAARELATLPAEIAAVRQRARDAREAAELLAPSIVEMNAPIEEAAQARKDALLDQAYEAHRALTEELMRRLAPDNDLIQAWIASAEAFEAHYGATLGRQPQMPEPLFQVGRFLAVHAQRVLGVRYAQVMGRVWPVQTADLAAVLDEVAPQVARRRQAENEAVRQQATV